MKRNVTWLIAIALMLTLTGCSHPADLSSPCAFSQERTATISTADAKGINIKAQVGRVNVVGRAGLKEVQVKGTACATLESALKNVKLTTERSSDGWVRVLTEVPRGQNRLDITVEVPNDLQLLARVDTGTLEVRGVNQGVNARGDAGTVTITDVKGPVTVESRNGAVTVTKVEGNVNVTRADNGVLVVTEIKGNVTLTKKTGAVAVTNVTGDLTVTGKVKGLVTQSGVSGAVKIPK